MATTKDSGVISLPAAADLSGSQYIAATVDANGNAAIAGAGVVILGIIENTTPAADTAGDYVNIRTSGITYWTCKGDGTAIAIGDPLYNGANGIGLKATIGTHNVEALAMEATTAAAGVIRVCLK